MKKKTNSNFLFNLYEVGHYIQSQPKTNETYSGVGIEVMQMLPTKLRIK